MEHIGWEKALIGTALYSPGEMAKAEDVRPNDFTGCHQLIWGSMLSLYHAGTLEPRSLIETLRERNNLSQVSSFEDPDISGEAYINELLVARGASIEHYVDKVLSYATRRQLESTAGIIVSYARDNHISADEALDKAETRIMSIRRNRAANMGISLRDLMAAFLPRIEQMVRGTYVPAYTPSLTNLRDMVTFVEEDEYVVIAARPGDGKSSVLRREAYIVARDHGPVLLFNLENSEADYASAFVSMVAGVNNQVLKNPRGISQELHRRIIEASEELAYIPIQIVSLGAPSIQEMSAIARAKIHIEKPKLVIVDYVQLIENNKENDNLNITTSSTTLRGWAINFKVPVIAAAQLNRDIERRGKGAEPELADLRSSGSLEQDATQVWFPRKLWYEPKPQQLMMFPENTDGNGRLLSKPPAIPVRFYVKKNRNGPTGITEPILWDRSTGLFRDLDMTRVDLNEHLDR